MGRLEKIMEIKHGAETIKYGFVKDKKNIAIYRFLTDKETYLDFPNALMFSKLGEFPVVKIKEVRNFAEAEREIENCRLALQSLSCNVSLTMLF